MIEGMGRSLLVQNRRPAPSRAGMNSVSQSQSQCGWNGVYTAAEQLALDSDSVLCWSHSASHSPWMGCHDVGMLLPCVFAK